MINISYCISKPINTFYYYFTVKFKYYIYFQDNIEQPNDILPTNWTEKEMYKLHYKYDDQLFVLSGVKACDGFIFNLYVCTNLNIFI